MPPRIRVDTEDLKRFAAEIDPISDHFEKTGMDISQSTYNLNDYGGQLPTKKYAMSAQHDALGIRVELKEDAEQLRTLAAKFEAADQETMEGFGPPPIAVSPEPPNPFFGFVHSIRLGWDPDTPDGTVTRPGDNTYGPTQNVDVGFILTHIAEKIHHRLCGEFCAFHIAGIKDLRSGFMKILMSGDADLIDCLLHDKTLHPDDMQRLYALLGVKTGKTISVFTGEHVDPKTFQDILAAGGKVTVLVNMDPTSGKITDPSKDMGVGHWVTVEDMWVDSTGTTWVEVYNPYNNQYEAYRWDTLSASMQYPGAGNENSGAYIPTYP